MFEKLSALRYDHGWVCVKRSAASFQGLRYSLGDPKVFYTTGAAVDSQYLSVLLGSEAILAAGAQCITHGASTEYYSKLLRGEQPEPPLPLPGPMIRPRGRRERPSSSAAMALEDDGEELIGAALGLPTPLPLPPPPKRARGVRAAGGDAIVLASASATSSSSSGANANAEALVSGGRRLRGAKKKKIKQASIRTKSAPKVRAARRTKNVTAAAPTEARAAAGPGDTDAADLGMGPRSGPIMKRSAAQAQAPAATEAEEEEVSVSVSASVRRPLQQPARSWSAKIP